jgi:tRNA(fMet)-specific endonuclease VapC
LLDTNVLVHLVRGDHAGQRIAQEFGLLRRADRPLISIVTVGEMLALAKKFAWGPNKRSSIREIASELVVLDIKSEGVLERYAQISDHCRKGPMQQNDMWIAACASVAHAEVLTFDKDFERLIPDMVKGVVLEYEGGS